MAQDDFDKLLDTMKRAGAALRDAEIPFALTGGLAVWARGGPRTEHDVDFLVKPEDAERAQEALVAQGLRGERPAEEWLLKVWEGDRMIDLIFDPAGGPIDDGWFDRAEQIEVYAITLPVASLEDVLVTKLMALNEQDLDYAPVLETARSVREQIDFDAVRERTAESPYARAFFTLLDGLEII
jgi:Uncharacterised nucleotidyltransferase